jgi:hypothetical protein
MHKQRFLFLMVVICAMQSVCTLDEPEADIDSTQETATDTVKYAPSELDVDGGMRKI